MLQVEDKDLTTRVDAVAGTVFQKMGKRKIAFEAGVKKALGSCLLGSIWEGRTFICHGLEPMSPSDECNRPYHGRIRVVMHNMRSDAARDADVIEVTTHAMERMLERSSNADLMAVLAKELTWKFIESFAQTLRTDIESRREIQVLTTTGIACIVIEPDTLPVLTTWYLQ
jgi:hypothetical protein